MDYEDFVNAGGERMPPGIWLRLCHVAEKRREFERALIESEKLIAAYPSERESVLAQLNAARICLKKLNRPADALKVYEAASTSAVPHLDIERDIDFGIQEAKAAISSADAAAIQVCCRLPREARYKEFKTVEKLHLT